MNNRCNRIVSEFPQLSERLSFFEQDIYIADYTEHDKNSPQKRDIEVSSEDFDDMDCFHIKNPDSLKLYNIRFSSDSFKSPDGRTLLSQCECITSPCCDDVDDEWILFLELKYCLSKNKTKNINKAKKQLQDTLELFVNKKLLDQKQKKYLIFSLPKISPFSSYIEPYLVSELKKKYNAIIRGTHNSVKISDKNKIEFE